MNVSILGTETPNYQEIRWQLGEQFVLDGREILLAIGAAE